MGRLGSCLTFWTNRFLISDLVKKIGLQWGLALFFPTSPVDNVSSYSIFLVFKTLVYQNFPSTAPRYQPCWHDYQSYIRGWAFDSHFYTQTGYGIYQSRQKFSQKIQKLTRVNVSACNNFYDILTLTILGNEKKYLQIPISATFFQFLAHLNQRLIWAHLASVVCH